jgi:hypothetical protein
MKTSLTLFLLLALPLLGQTNQGEIRFRVTDPAGLGVKSSVRIVSEANQYRHVLSTDERGVLTVQRLPFGVYEVEINQPGFANWSNTVEVRSSIPAETLIQLKVASIRESVTVSAPSTLINPDQAGSINQIGTDAVEHRLSSIPGRSLQDLVNSQPGWLYEGNAVLHPRGSEYQTQFVVDGIPLTDNRSPSFGPAIDADDVQSLTIYTAGIPAEYGRKMGGVVEVNTLQDSQPGFHGQVVLSGGSFDTAGASAQGQYAWGKNTFGASASGSMTDHYLNPVVTQNFTNSGTLGDFSVNYERELTPKDRLRFIVRHEFSRYDIPNEQVQQANGQLQTADNLETMGIASYQHTFLVQWRWPIFARWSATTTLASTPMRNRPDRSLSAKFLPRSVLQGNGHHHSRPNEWKFGFESDNLFLNENFPLPHYRSHPI